MPLGQLSGKPRIQQVQQPASTAPGAGLSLLSRATSRLANELDLTSNEVESMKDLMANRQERTLAFDAKRNLVSLSGDLARETEELRRNLPENGQGFLTAVTDLYEKRGGAWLATLPPKLREELAPQLETLTQKAVTSAFSLEYAQGNEAFERGLQDVMNQFTSEVLVNPEAADEALGRFADLLDTSDLEESRKAELMQVAETRLLTSRFQGELRQYRLGGDGIVGDGNDNDIVAGGMAGWERTILNRIAGPESGGKYDRRYTPGGGTTFEETGQHPRIFERRPDGRLSSAAGRYQFTWTQWKETAREMGIDVNDFSRANQDKAAIFLAKKRYRINTGRDLETDMLSGDRELIKGIRGALEGTWEGFKGMSDDAFANYVMGTQGMMRGPKTPPDAPDVFNDPAYAGMSMEDKLAMEASVTAETSSQLREEALQYKAELEQAKQSLIANIDQGNVTDNDIVTAFEQGTIDAEEKQQLHDRLDKVQADQRDIADVRDKIAGGETLNDSDENALSLFWNDRSINDEGESLSDQLNQGNQKIVNEVLLPIGANNGKVPEDATNTLRRMATGVNPKQKMFGLEALLRLKKNAPDAYRGMGLPKELEYLVDYYNEIKPYTSGEEELAQYLSFYNDPNTQDQVEKLRVLGAEKAATDYDIDYLTNVFDPSIKYGDQPEAPTGPRLVGFQSDWNKRFADNFALTGGNVAMTESLTNKQVKQIWMPSEVGGGNFIGRYPPESFAGGKIRTVNKSLDWVTLQVRKEFDLPATQVFKLLGDDQTANEGLNPNKDVIPSYYVLLPDDSGFGGKFVKDEKGVPIRYYPKISDRDHDMLLEIYDLQYKLDKQGMGQVIENTGDSVQEQGAAKRTANDRIKELFEKLYLEEDE